MLDAYEAHHLPAKGCVVQATVDGTVRHNGARDRTYMSGNQYVGELAALV